MGSESRACANGILRLYRQRNQMLGCDLFASSGWEILIALFAIGSPLSVSEIAEQLNAPETTVARWVKVLEVRGLVEPTTAAANDGQFELSSKGTQSLTFLLGGTHHTQAA